MQTRGIQSKRFGHDVEYDPPESRTPIGVIVPFDFSLDWEYWSYLPPGVALHFTRTPHLRRAVGVRLAREVGRRSAVLRAAQALSSLRPAALLYACSSGSFIDGVAGEREIREAMLASGAPDAVTTAGATVSALAMTGMEKIAVVTPYTARLTGRLTDFLTEAGFDVVSAYHLGLTENISQVSKATIAELVRAADDCEADAVLVSCTALHTWGIIHDLEGELGRPVFTSNQVSLWGVLMAAGALGTGLGEEGSEWTMGGDEPARSTKLLLEAAHRHMTHTAA